jgi:hypothetical protein
VQRQGLQLFILETKDYLQPCMPGAEPHKDTLLKNFHRRHHEEKCDSLRARNLTPRLDSDPYRFVALCGHVPRLLVSTNYWLLITRYFCKHTADIKFISVVALYMLNGYGNGSQTKTHSWPFQFSSKWLVFCSDPSRRHLVDRFT